MSQFASVAGTPLARPVSRRRQEGLRFGERLGRIGLALAALVAGLTSCGRDSSPKAPTAQTSNVRSDERPVPAETIDGEIAKALEPDPSSPPGSAAGQATRPAGSLEDEAEDILRRHPGKNAQELLNVPEVNARLASALKKLAADPQLQQAIKTTVDVAAQFKGLDGPPGSARLDLDVTQYDRPRTSRMLQAVLSEDPGQIVNFLVGEIGEATPDISYGGMQRAANGVAILPVDQPPVKPASPAPNDE